MALGGRHVSERPGGSGPGGTPSLLLPLCCNQIRSREMAVPRISREAQTLKVMLKSLWPVNLEHH